MNKPLKYALCGVGSAVGIFILMTLVRSLVRGIPFTEGIKDVANIVIAIVCGVSTAMSMKKKDDEKEKKEKNQ